MAHMPPPSVDDLPMPAVLKVHRLGRISFRKIKEKRDYLGKRKSAPNWMYLSRLAAKKEWQFMQVGEVHWRSKVSQTHADSPTHPPPPFSFFRSSTSMAFLSQRPLHTRVTRFLCLGLMDTR